MAFIFIYVCHTCINIYSFLIIGLFIETETRVEQLMFDQKGATAKKIKNKKWSKLEQPGAKTA